MKKGISLITLVITIVVVIILAAAVILSLGSNNPINSSKIASLLQSKASMEDGISISVTKYITESSASSQTEDVIIKNQETNIILDDDGSGDRIINVTIKNYNTNIYRIDKEKFKERFNIDIKNIPSKDSSWYVDANGKIYLVYGLMENVPEYLKENNTTLNKSVEDFVIVLDRKLAEDESEKVEIEIPGEILENSIIKIDASKANDLEYFRWVINNSEVKLGIDDEEKYTNKVDGKNTVDISMDSITRPGTYYLHVLICSKGKKFEKISKKIVKPDLWDGSIAEGFASGNGTEDDPFIIESSAQLAYLSSISEKNSEGKYFKLNCDLDLNNKEWNPIYSFKGIFDGESHTIKNLFCSKQWTPGLFSNVTNGKLKNIIVENATFNYENNANFPYVGSIASQAYKSSFENCISKKMTVNFTNVWPAVGGIVGRANYCEFKNCINYVNFEDDISRSNNIGGITGDDGSGKYTYCINYGDIVVTNEKKYGSVGGICGSDGGATSYTRCGNFGNITNPNKAGGISGYGTSGATFESCFNRGNITTTEKNQEAGGLAPYSGSTAKNCYNTGKISSEANQKIAGLVGEYGISTSNCYNIGEIVTENERSGYITTFEANSKGHTNIFYLDTLPKLYRDNYYSGNAWFGVSKTQEEFKKNYTEEDSVTYILNNGVIDSSRTWTIDSSRNNGYPILIWELGIQERK